ncbi:MAG: hypothetical protein H0W83_03915 [Planctomycetes bacterium]|nr:hypothetical protein [Planctomycetota bacterium]
MNEIITIAGAFPTAIFTGLLIAALFYWVMVILGAFDLGLGHHHGDAAHADGSAGGHGPGGAGHTHGHDSADPHAHESGSDGHGLLEFLSVGQVPLSITVSAIVFIAWIVSMTVDLTTHAVFARILPEALFDLGQGGLSLLIGLVAGALLVRPLRPLFAVTGEHGHGHLEGRMVRITSRTVDQRFGTASFETSGPDILLNVVCRAEHTLSRDEFAVVVEYDQSRGVYLVAPLPHMRADAATIAAASPLVPPPAPANATESPAPFASAPAPASARPRAVERPQ